MTQATHFHATIRRCDLRSGGAGFFVAAVQDSDTIERFGRPRSPLPSLPTLQTSRPTRWLPLQPSWPLRLPLLPVPPLRVPLLLSPKRSPPPPPRLLHVAAMD